MKGWASKVGRSGVQTAHYLDAAGTPLCATMKFRDGPALAPFTCAWTELREQTAGAGTAEGSPGARRVGQDFYRRARRSMSAVG